MITILFCLYGKTNHYQIYTSQKDGLQYIFLRKKQGLNQKSKIQKSCPNIYKWNGAAIQIKKDDLNQPWSKSEI